MISLWYFILQLKRAFRVTSYHDFPPWVQAVQLVPLHFAPFRRVALALQGWHRQTSGDLIWKIHFAFLFQKKMNNFKWHKKRAKVQFRRRTETKRVAWSGPHATWRFNEARIVWHAVVLVLFSTICNLFFWFVKNHSWSRIIFHSFHWLFKFFLHEL